MTAQGLSSPDAMVRDVLHGLSEGRYVPGQRLSEPELMLRYGLGRSTVREALSRLAAAGVTENRPHRGAMIRQLTLRQMRDLLEVLALLLGLAARQAAQAVAAGGDGTALAQALDTWEAAPPPEALRARARYYRELFQLAGNEELDRLMPGLQVHLLRAQAQGVAEDRRSLHAAIVAAILAADAPRAEGLARDHVLRLSAGISALAQDD